MVESRSVQRRPIEDRWSRDAIEGITATPWSTRTVKPAQRSMLGDAVDEHLPLEEITAPVPRRLKITIQTVRKYGLTDGCPQCDHIKAFNETKNGLGHTEKCRKRILEDMAKTTEGAARLHDDEVRINRGLAEAVRIGDKTRAAELPLPLEDAHDAAINPEPKWSEKEYMEQLHRQPEYLEELRRHQSESSPAHKSSRKRGGGRGPMTTLRSPGRHRSPC